jgi:hypothetical protein
MDANQPGSWVNGTAREATPAPTSTMENNLARLTSNRQGAHRRRPALTASAWLWA